MPIYNYNTPGLGNTASYQVSGKPFATGNISPVNGVVEIVFPAVTSWVLVKNAGATAISVGFSEAGLIDSNNLIKIDRAPGPGYEVLGPLDLKLTRLYLSGSRSDTKSMHVLAGLTGIPIKQLDNVTGTVAQYGAAGILGPNWSGSAGVG